MKYFYIDSEGNKKRYRGKVEKRNDDLVGIIVSQKKTKYISELNKESNSVIEDKEISYKVYTDKFGNEHKIDNSDEIADNVVVKEYNEEFDITFIPPVEEKEYFTIKGKNDIYNGKVIEDNGKFFGEI